MIFVIADSHQQFEYFRQHEKMTLDECYFIWGLSGVTKLTGRPRDTRVVAYGTCASLEAWRAIQLTRDLGFKIEWIYEFEQDNRGH